MHGFTEFKRWLVSEIGWGGMLDVAYAEAKSKIQFMDNEQSRHPMFSVIEGSEV
jgi:hypothetical protein